MVNKMMAERVGFEPTVPVKVQQFSRLPDSTTLAPLRESLMIKDKGERIKCRATLGATGSEELLHQFAAFVSQDTGNDLDTVI